MVSPNPEPITTGAYISKGSAAAAEYRKSTPELYATEHYSAGNSISWKHVGDQGGRCV